MYSPDRRSRVSVYLFLHVNKSSELDNSSRSFCLLLNKLSKRMKRMSKNKYARHMKRMGTSRGLSLVYAFAESEVMEEVVDTLEELLELSWQLFGTPSWLTTQQPWPEIAQEEEASGDGWFPP
jgi:hypothetical protein